MHSLKSLAVSLISILRASCPSRYHIMVLSKRRCDLVIFLATLEEPGPRHCGFYFWLKSEVVGGAAPSSSPVGADVCLLIDGGVHAIRRRRCATKESCCSWSTEARDVFSCPRGLTLAQEGVPRRLSRLSSDQRGQLLLM